MRYLNQDHLEMCRSLTAYVQHDRSDLARAVRQALAERHVNAETSAVADFCPESASLAAGESVELHHLVIVDNEAHAFVGMLHRTATSAHFGQWRDVPSTPIAERNATVRRINDNLRHRRDWNTDIDPSITDPKDVIYNELIEAALVILDGSSGGNDSGP
jgi:hypothetical protein